MKAPRETPTIDVEVWEEMLRMSMLRAAGHPITPLVDAMIERIPLDIRNAPPDPERDMQAVMNLLFPPAAKASESTKG